MSTELAILLGLFAFILFGAFVGEDGPKSTFGKSSPKLGARLEKHLETGAGFTYAEQSRIQWIPAPKIDGGGQ